MIRWLVRRLADAVRDELDFRAYSEGRTSSYSDFATALDGIEPNWWLEDGMTDRKAWAKHKRWLRERLDAHEAAFLRGSGGRPAGIFGGK